MRHKASSAQWLEVMETAHRLGLRTTATMMFGHVEKIEDRIEHLFKLQSLQEKTGGFTAFICWSFQKTNTPMEKGNFYVSPNEYLRVLALSRILLVNFVNIQVSFVTMSTETASMGLYFGGNDFGSIMIEENVVRAAGADNPMTEPMIRGQIEAAGYIPRRRNMGYDLLPEPQKETIKSLSNPNLSC
jgi:cyclic dehypoxanthinyl futalosine synthase